MLESEEASGLSGVDGTESELSMSDGREDEELLLDDVSGTEMVVPEDADDELCEELVDGVSS